VAANHANGAVASEEPETLSHHAQRRPNGGWSTAAGQVSQRGGHRSGIGHEDGLGSLHREAVPVAPDRGLVAVQDQVTGHTFLAADRAPRSRRQPRTSVLTGFRDAQPGP